MDSERIKQIRASTGLSQARFAELLSVSERSIQQWECGNRNPNGPSTIRLLELEKKNRK